ncbi:hypothetical protein GUJ93_ZPchr0011g28347 [Zizania palustris]|uniref:Uncharacterized protein n=1 Tax=Zizania palustris TaxID=103762 RepID=A0A8J5WFE3_ZIZPA|nr:hypothetical protein GUJ93_ZPchr0011g28347 [Zizania palustris]
MSHSIIIESTTSFEKTRGTLRASQQSTPSQPHHLLRLVVLRPPPAARQACGLPAYLPCPKPRRRGADHPHSRPASAGARDNLVLHPLPD